MGVVIQQEGDQGAKAVTEEERLSQEPAAAEVEGDKSVNGNSLCDSVAKHHLQPSDWLNQSVSLSVCLPRIQTVVVKS